MKKFAAKSPVIFEVILIIAAVVLVSRKKQTDQTVPAKRTDS